MERFPSLRKTTTTDRHVTDRQATSSSTQRTSQIRPQIRSQQLNNAEEPVHTFYNVSLTWTHVIILHTPLRRHHGRDTRLVPGGHFVFNEFNCNEKRRRRRRPLWAHLGVAGRPAAARVVRPGQGGGLHPLGGLLCAQLRQRVVLVSSSTWSSDALLDLASWLTPRQSCQSSVVRCSSDSLVLLCIFLLSHSPISP